MLQKSAELERLEALPRPIVTFARELGPGQQIERHSHRRAQLVYAQSGVLTVTADAGIWVIPPQRAVWMPGGMNHSIRASGPVAMRSLYVESTPALPRECRVVNIPPLLRELIRQAFNLPRLYDPDGPDGRLMIVLLDQLEQLPVARLHLPMPADPRLRRITGALTQHPADGRGLAQWARLAGASSRTLSRLFVQETGMTFGAWRQQARLLKALEWLAQDMPVTAIALDLGYESPSAFIAMFRRTLGVSPSRYFNQP
jgi:AraC-like DNA-binding protein